MLEALKSAVNPTKNLFWDNFDIGFQKASGGGDIYVPILKNEATLIDLFSEVFYYLICSLCDNNVDENNLFHNEWEVH